MATKTIENIEGEKLCKPCAGKSYFQLDGKGINLKKTNKNKTLKDKR